MLETTISGSLPKPAWLAEEVPLWAPWRIADEDQLAQAKRDAVRLALLDQEDAGIDIVSDGEQSRQHFVHGFLERIEGIDFARKKRIGIRADRYEADCPTVVGAIRRPAPVHAEDVRFARAHTSRKLKFTLPGPMTIVDTLADDHYGDRPTMAMDFARVLNQEARDLEAAGADVIQFDEPAYNVYLDEVKDWGIETLDTAVAGLSAKTAIHICYGYGIKANNDWKKTLGSEWRQYAATFPTIAESQIDQVSLELAHSGVPTAVIDLLGDKDVLVGVIDVATDTVETPGEVAALIRQTLAHAPAERIFPCTNCGMVPLARTVAVAKLRALAAGAAITRDEL
ncbi:MAG: methionine synthase [Alphaproteobacteria bacterium]|jgi:5-methyltetrahydropteroyltriglutamate--homocysteine methyltransferase|nr:methionine synthase [Alphaproteobacteria bacterium]MDP6518129.1 methionine synthase [Alphaproteobacteria bacterium]